VREAPEVPALRDARQAGDTRHRIEADTAAAIAAGMIGAACVVLCAVLLIRVFVVPLGTGPVIVAVVATGLIVTGLLAGGVAAWLYDRRLESVCQQPLSAVVPRTRSLAPPVSGR